MKTIKEKAEAYDKAIEIIRKCETDKYGCIIGIKPSDIFSELKGSKDERIIRVIRGWIYTQPASFFDNGISKEEILDWIEKQGDINKRIQEEIEKQTKQQWKSENKGEQIDLVNKEYWRGYREGKQEILDKYSKLENQGEHKCDYEHVGCHVNNSKRWCYKKQSEIPYEKCNTKCSEYLNDVEQKHGDKVEPKFKIGDIVKHKNNPHLTCILKRFTDNGDYEFHAIGKDGNKGCTCFYGIKYQDEWELVEQNPSTEVKQKFKVGDWVVSPNGVYWHIDTIRNDRYQVSSNSGECADWPLDTNIYHRFTIQDAKEGDVLRIGNLTFIFQEITNNNVCHKDAVIAYCSYEDNDEAFGASGPDCITDLELITPATKEQCDLLFKAMAGAGYEWDTDKKKLKIIKTKFKVGDWITNGNLVGEIDEIHECGYHAYFGYYYADVSDIENWHKWTIKDAKDADILATDNGLVFIYNGYLEEQQWPFAYGGINIYGRFNICDGLLPFTHQKIVPATKEQHDVLMKAMADAGYIFDFEKKELKEIGQDYTMMSLDEAIEHCEEKSCGNNACALEHKQLANWLTELKELKEHTPSWSEEDEVELINIINFFDSSSTVKLCATRRNEAITWLKSLKDRVQLQNSSVTDEELAQAEKDAYNNALDKIEYHSGEPTYADGWHDAIDCIKKNCIIPQTTWVPSDEQMEILQYLCETSSHQNEKVIPTLKSLYNDLKKLKE